MSLRCASAAVWELRLELNFYRAAVLIAAVLLTVSAAGCGGAGMVTKKIEIDGVEIVYNQAGSGPVVLYVHGNLGSRIWFERNMDIPGFTTIAPDMPNFGDSGRIDGHSMEAYGSFMSAFLKAVAPEGVALLVGHSLGGAVAMETAFGLPELVDSMILVDSCPVDGLHTPEAYHTVIEQYKTDRQLLKKSLGGVVPALNDDGVLEKLVDQALKMKPETFVGHAVELGKVSYSTGAAGFNKPVLVVRGAMDVLITAEMAAKLAAAFPSGEIEEIAGVGHSLMVENPGEFNRIILEFLR